jgi:SAM-dependent methyltransferase
MLKNNSFSPQNRETLDFSCNICGNKNVTWLDALGRETPSCSKCGSTVRMRAIIGLLSMELFGRILKISDFPVRVDIHGMGMSDWEEYADRLAEKFNYINTFYHKEPRLDIKNIDTTMEKTFDFIISTDVFEHVEPDISTAFSNTYKLLKPNGTLIFSVC